MGKCINTDFSLLVIGVCFFCLHSYGAACRLFSEIVKVEVMEVNHGISQCMIALCHFCEHHGPCVIFHTRLTAECDIPVATRKLSSPAITVSCTVI